MRLELLRLEPSYTCEWLMSYTSCHRYQHSYLYQHSYKWHSYLWLDVYDMTHVVHRWVTCAWLMSQMSHMWMTHDTDESHVNDSCRTHHVTDMNATCHTNMNMNMTCHTIGRFRRIKVSFVGFFCKWELQFCERPYASIHFSTISRLLQNTGLFGRM